MGNMEKRIDNYWSLRAEEFSRYRILDLAGPVRMIWHEFFKKELPDDVIVYIVLHEDTNDMGETKLRTIGKLIDNKVCMEGMVTICIRCMSDNGKHFFRTQTDGFDITKTPEDMFEEAEIDNNLKLVDDTIREFYGWKESKK